MVALYLRRGLAAGLLAGLLAGVFAFVVGEPLLDRAIELEESAHAHEDGATRTERAKRSSAARPRRSASFSPRGCRERSSGGSSGWPSRTSGDASTPRATGLAACPWRRRSSPGPS